jgi:hypothetical protein
MKATALLPCLVLALLAAPPAAAQVARPGDKAVAKLIGEAIDSVEEFERRLDPSLRKGTIRGESAEVDVSRYLDDFEEDFERLRKRFKPDYSASAEAVAVLRRANDIDRYMKSQPPSLKGRSEWDVAAADLNRLAGAYGTEFPAAGTISARRVNDREIETAAATVMQQAQAYRKALKPAYAKEEAAALKAAQANADALAQAAKALKTRIAGGDPASGEAGVLLEKLAAVEQDAAGRTLPEPATAAWTGITRAVARIKDAFAAS